MFSVDFAKRMKHYINTYSSFDFPVIICESNYNYFWSNQAARSVFTRMDGNINPKAMLQELDLEKVNEKLLDDGFYIAADIIPFQNQQVNIYPILHPTTNEIDAIILVFLEQSLRPNHTLANFYSKTADNLSDNLREILQDVFSTIDIIALKADLFNADWVIPHLNQVGFSSYEILRLASNVTAYTKLQNQQVSLEKAVHDIRGRLDASKPSIIAVARTAGIPVHFDLPEEPVYLPLDSTWFQIAFYNILHNSIYYTSPENEITISVTNSSDFVEISIEDKGIGIPEDIMPSIFRPYFSDNRDQSSGGVGLGLALSSRIIEMHGGDLEVHSEVGEGTTVTISLPASKFTDNLMLNQSNSNASLFSAGSFHDKFSPLYIGLTSAVVSPFTENLNQIDKKIRKYRSNSN